MSERDERRARKAADSPAWHGFVFAHDGMNGVVRRRVRIPDSALESFAVGPVLGPNMKTIIVAETVADMRKDAFVHALHAEQQKRAKP